MRNSGAFIIFAAVCAGLGAFILLSQPKQLPERPTHPSARTNWSSPSEAQQKAWHSFHTRLSAEVMSYEAKSGVPQLVLVGDSIIEHLRGTSYGIVNPKAALLPAVLAETLGVRYPRPHVLGISGDQTQHVLWRLAHGELTAEMEKDPNLTLVLLVGTNNLGAGHLPEETVAGIFSIARRVMLRIKGRLLVSALLPRGDGPSMLPQLCPPRCNHDGKPFNSFSPAVKHVNKRLQILMKSLALRHPRRVGFADCGAPFQAANKSIDEVNVSLMPDRLHPDAAGWRVLAKCFDAALVRLASV